MAGIRSGFAGGGKYGFFVLDIFGHFDHHDGDVIGGAMFEGDLDQIVDGLLQGARLAHDAFSDLVGDDGIEAVGAEEPAFPRCDGELVDIEFGTCVGVTQDPHQHVLMRVVFGFLGPQAALVHESLDEGVVLADLFEDTVLEPVSAGIANMGVLEAVSGQQQRRHGGAHSREFRVRADQVVKDGIGCLDFVRKHRFHVNGRVLIKMY